jgi:hypothetical protein
MKPVMRIEVTHAEPLDGRGHRSPADILARDERDHFLRAAADRFCTGMSDRAAATHLRAKLARYRENGWRRDRSNALCPPRLAGRIDALMWCVLKVRDQVPSERLIRLVLARD